jgi:hypothetical protein
MPAIVKKTHGKTHGHAIVSDKVKSYANDPYFVKKAEEAKETLERVGLPDQRKHKQ